MLSPILSVMRSIASISSFLGKSVDTSKYPGINKRSGKPTITRRGDELNGGTLMIPTDTNNESYNNQ
jgi:hypothetical protein